VEDETFQQQPDEDRYSTRIDEPEPAREQPDDEWLDDDAED
jgi:hypothetical protein